MFDLDGTLTDSRPGITRCIEHALAEVGAAIPATADLTRCVGPPLPSVFAALLGTTEAGRIERASLVLEAKRPASLKVWTEAELS